MAKSAGSGTSTPPPLLPVPPELPPLVLPVVPVPPVLPGIPLDPGGVPPLVVVPPDPLLLPKELDPPLVEDVLCPHPR
jgi:hypothetical protein